MLFFTKTNIGMDIDTKPPTAEIRITRLEGLIAPTFIGGRMLPVFGGFHYYGNYFAPNVAAVFSGGRAATNFTDASTTTPPVEDESRICVAEVPKAWAIEHLIGTEKNDEVRPFFFSTDSGTGLKVAWSGTAGAFPDSFQFGYKRKEFAYAPIFGPTNPKAPPDCSVSGSGPLDGYALRVPSFIATLEGGFSVATAPGGTGGTSGSGGNSGNVYDYSQFFATGKAAENLALQPSIRETLGKRVDPKAFDQFVQSSDKNRAEAKKLNDKVAAAAASATDTQLDTMLAQARTAGLLTDTSYPAGMSTAKKREFLINHASATGDNKERLDTLRTFAGSLT